MRAYRIYASSGKWVEVSTGDEDGDDKVYVSVISGADTESCEGHRTAGLALEDISVLISVLNKASSKVYMGRGKLTGLARQYAPEEDGLLSGQLVPEKNFGDY